MAIYAIIIAVVGFLSYGTEYLRHERRNSTKQLRWFLVFIIAAILVIVTGIRGVGADFGNYERLYNNVKVQSFGSIIRAFINFDEPGYKLICWISYLIYDDPVTMMIICAFITILPSVIVMYKQKGDFCFYMVFYVLIVWTQCFGAIRQCIAATMLFCAYPYLKNKNFWKYLLFVLIACCFHATAIIMLPLYFILNHKISLGNVAFIAVIAVILRFSYDQIFELVAFIKGEDMDLYSYHLTEVNLFRVIVSFAPIVLFLFLPKDYGKNNDDGKADIKGLNLAFNFLILNAALMFASMGSAYLARVCMYTTTFLPFAIYEIIKHYDWQSRKALILIMFVCYVAYFTYDIYAHGLSYITYFQR